MKNAKLAFMSFYYHQIGVFMEKIVIDFLQTHTEVTLFLALAIGYLIGKIKNFNFNLGATASVLIVALILGQVGVTISPPLQAVSFSLFIFCIGYKVGPEFFSGFKQGGIKYIWLSIFIALTALFTAVGISEIMGFDPGTAAGLLGGAMTQSSIIGTADSAIYSLPIDSALQDKYVGNIAIAYAITYLFGTAGMVVFYKLAPKMMRVNLKEEAKKLMESMSGAGSASEDSGILSWNKRVNLIIVKVTNAKVIGKSIKSLEKEFENKIVVHAIKRSQKIQMLDPNEKLQKGDLISIMCKYRAIEKILAHVGEEVNDDSMADVKGDVIKVCVLNKKMIGKKLKEINKYFPNLLCFIRKLTRQNHEIPLTENTIIHKCDVIEISGPVDEVKELSGFIGYVEKSMAVTDLVVLGFGCVAGILIGLLSVNIFSIPISLGTGGGVLVAGLFCGWLRSVHGTFGQIPSGAQWLMTDLGLNMFIACVGLTAGPEALKAIQQSGLQVLLAGMIVSLTPAILGLLFGRYILKLNPVLLFGAMVGAGTITAALNSIKEEAGSSMPALGYTVPYAFGNVLLTVVGALIVHLI